MLVSFDAVIKRIRIQEANMLRIQRIWILNTGSDVILDESRNSYVNVTVRKENNIFETITGTHPLIPPALSYSRLPLSVSHAPPSPSLSLPAQTPSYLPAEYHLNF